MTDSLYLRLKSLNTRTVRGVTSPKNIVRVAAMHNLREIQAELGASAASGINPARMHLNYQLRGPATADEVACLALALLDNAGVTTLRRDACMALELVVSLPAATAIDHREYFTAAVTWADAYFNVPILSAAVHLDEAAPHCHILLLPLVAGRMQGGALAGGPAKIRAMLADFQQQVAQRFGLTHQPRAKRLSKPNRDAAGRMVLDALRARPERLSEPAMRDALVAALGSHAETLLALLGLSMSTTKAKAKSFADIMTAPCKPERSRRAAPNTKHIDVAQILGNQDGEKFDNVYLCVDIAPSPSPILAAEQPLAPATDSTADHHTSRTNIVRLVEQREPATGDAQQQDDQRQHSAENSAQQQAARVEQRQSDTAQRQPADTRLSFQDAPAASDEKRTKAPATRAPAHPQLSFEPCTDQRQQSSSAFPAPTAPVQTVSLAQAGAGNLSDTPTAAGARKPARISRLPGAGAAPLSPASTIRTMPAQVPARPGITENPETGFTSALPAPGHSAHHRRHAAKLTHEGELRQDDADEYRRVRDGDQPAATWCSDRGEFVSGSGPPPSACHLYP